MLCFEFDEDRGCDFFICLPACLPVLLTALQRLPEAPPPTIWVLDCVYVSRRSSARSCLSGEAPGRLLLEECPCYPNRRVLAFKGSNAHHPFLAHCFFPCRSYTLSTTSPLHPLKQEVAGLQAPGVSGAPFTSIFGQGLLALGALSARSVYWRVRRGH